MKKYKTLEDLLTIGNPFYICACFTCVNKQSGMCEVYKTACSNVRYCKKYKGNGEKENK